MKKTVSLWNSKAWNAVGTLILIAVLTLVLGVFTSRADETVKVNVAGANIRKEATTGSDIVGNVKRDAVLTVVGQTTAADGKVWYKVQVDASTTGYIRSDLVVAGDAATATPTPSPSATPKPSTPLDTSKVTEVQPVGGTVKGAENVRVRSAADTSNNDNVLASVKKGTVVTVKGTVTGADSKTWYLIHYVENNKEVNGFIRSDYVELSGELKDPVAETPEDPVEDPGKTEEPKPTEKPQEKSKYEVWYDENDAKWILVDNEELKSWEISQIFYAATANAKLYQDEAAKTSKQKVLIIVLIIIILALAGALAFVIYKWRGESEAAYIDKVERETIQRRTAERPQGQRPQGQRPQGQRPQGQRPQGQRPQGQRPQGQGAQGQRPQGQRPQGQRPQGQHPQGQHPQGAVSQVQKSVVPQMMENTKIPASRETEKQSVAAAEKVEATHVVIPEEKPVAPVEVKETMKPETTSRKPKNFAQDDDEFEFEFLNWNGDEDK